MKASIATVCLSGGLNEKLEAIAAAGFKSVEIFESDLLSYNGTPADVAKDMKSLGLKPITFQPFRDFEGMPDAQRQKTFDRAERKFDLMQELDCPYSWCAAMSHRHRSVASTAPPPISASLASAQQSAA
jgi:4-hydroxyphenylpyruvate dioxygenase